MTADEAKAFVKYTVQGSANPAVKGYVRIISESAARVAASQAGFVTLRFLGRALGTPLVIIDLLTHSDAAQ
jgi:hypothetical protein